MTHAPLEQLAAGTLDRLMVDASELARLLGVSRRHIERLDAAGRLPRGVKLGRSKKWFREHVLEWARAGCPDRARWEQRKSK